MQCLQRSEEGAGLSGTGVTDGCEGTRVLRAELSSSATDNC